MSTLRFALIATLLVACGEDGGDGNSGCLPGSYDIDKAWGFTQGTLEIAGTIMLPAELASGRGLQLNIVQRSPDSGNTIDFATVSGAKSAVTYRARGLVDGSWTICLRVDVNGNNALNEVGVDYTGCYDGTVAAPMRDPFMATPIVLGGACQADRDFGVGLYQ